MSGPHSDCLGPHLVYKHTRGHHKDGVNQTEKPGVLRLVCPLPLDPIALEPSHSMVTSILGLGCEEAGDNQG